MSEIKKNNLTESSSSEDLTQNNSTSQGNSKIQNNNDCDYLKEARNKIKPKIIEFLKKNETSKIVNNIFNDTNNQKIIEGLSLSGKQLMFWCDKEILEQFKKIKKNKVNELYHMENENKKYIIPFIINYYYDLGNANLIKEILLDDKNFINKSFKIAIIQNIINNLMTENLAEETKLSIFKILMEEEEFRKILIENDMVFATISCIFNSSYARNVIQKQNRVEMINNFFSFEDIKLYIKTNAENEEKIKNFKNGNEFYYEPLFKWGSYNDNIYNFFLTKDFLLGAKDGIAYMLFDSLYKNTAQLQSYLKNILENKDNEYEKLINIALKQNILQKIFIRSIKDGNDEILNLLKNNIGIDKIFKKETMDKSVNEIIINDCANIKSNKELERILNDPILGEKITGESLYHAMINIVNINSSLDISKEGFDLIFNNNYIMEKIREYDTRNDIFFNIFNIANIFQNTYILNYLVTSNNETIKNQLSDKIEDVLNTNINFNRPKSTAILINSGLFEIENIKNKLENLIEANFTPEKTQLIEILASNIAKTDFGYVLEKFKKYFDLIKSDNKYEILTKAMLNSLLEVKNIYQNEETIKKQIDEIVTKIILKNQYNLITENLLNSGLLSVDYINVVFITLCSQKKFDINIIKMFLENKQIQIDFKKDCFLKACEFNNIELARIIYDYIEKNELEKKEEVEVELLKFIDESFENSQGNKAYLLFIIMLEKNGSEIEKLFNNTNEINPNKDKIIQLIKNNKDKIIPDLENNSEAINSLLVILKNCLTEDYKKLSNKINEQKKKFIKTKEEKLQENISKEIIRIELMENNLDKTKSYLKLFAANREELLIGKSKIKSKA